MNLQPVFDLAQICHLKGIQNAVISPGSRNAALIIAFARHPKIKCYSMPDERSAAFMALGMSLKTQLPTILICTSGSAALNYAPAIAEAYFNQIPLLVLSADRPPEWIGQRDGQTIFQENLFGKHIKKSFIFPSLDTNENTVETGHQIVTEAINTAMTDGKGPVHINIPFREPFYPEGDFDYPHPDELILNTNFDKPTFDSTQFIQDFEEFSKVLIVVGQSPKDNKIAEALTNLSTNHQIPIIGDIISNIRDVEGVITSQDAFLKNLEDNVLQPDLLITVGMSVISKNLKIFLRNQKPKTHWHVRREENTPDTYQAITKHIQADALEFLSYLLSNHSTNSIQESFFKQWLELNTRTKNIIEHHTSETFSDFNGYKIILDSIPAKTDLHLANSMAVRYANTIGIQSNQDIEVFCNRGTSGIDGSNSTAVGSALMTDRRTLLLTGDMAFLYDRNAFWHNHLPNHIKIVVFNNHGGGIFRMIEGPSAQPELEEYFETRQQKDASFVAEEYDFEYLSCRNDGELEQAIPIFMNTKGRKILEIFTDAEESKLAYKEIFQKLSN